MYEKLKLNFQRWFYSIIGSIIISFIIYLTYEQIKLIKKDNHEFAIYILFIIHSIYIFISLLSTAIYCRITNAVLTTLTIVLLSTFISIHFYIRFVVFHQYRHEDFYILIIRLCLIMILFILLIPWTNIIVYKYRMNNITNKEIKQAKSITFSWFLYLDFMLIISLLILNIRNQSNFHSYRNIFSIGISFSLIWLCLGIHMANNKIHHYIISFIFYILSLIEIIYLGFIIFRIISEYQILSLKMNQTNLFSLLILIMICNGTNILIHILTIIMSLLNKFE